MADEGIQRQRARHTVDQRQHVGAEGLLQLGVLVQVVQDHLRHGVALEHEHEALAGTAGGLVAHVGDPVKRHFSVQPVCDPVRREMTV